MNPPWDHSLSVVQSSCLHLHSHEITQYYKLSTKHFTWPHYFSAGYELGSGEYSNFVSRGRWAIPLWYKNRYIPWDTALPRQQGLANGKLCRHSMANGKLCRQLWIHICPLGAFVRNTQQMFCTCSQSHCCFRGVIYNKYCISYLVSYSFSVFGQYSNGLRWIMHLPLACALSCPQELLYCHYYIAVTPSPTHMHTH